MNARHRPEHNCDAAYKEHDATVNYKQRSRVLQIQILCPPGEVAFQEHSQPNYGRNHLVWWSIFFPLIFFREIKCMKS